MNNKNKNACPVVSLGSGGVEGCQDNRRSFVNTESSLDFQNRSLSSALPTEVFDAFGLEGGQP